MDLRETEAATYRRHPWEIARYQIVSKIIGQQTSSPFRCLDVGSGDAWFASELAKQFKGSSITCVDSNYSDRDLERISKAGLVSCRRDLPYGEPYDVATMLDVIEHVEDDAGFLRAVADNVAPGGKVVITVPAWQALFSSHDVSLGHYRRYSPAQISRVIRDADLELVASGGMFPSLIAPRFAIAGVEKIREKLGFSVEIDTRPHTEGASKVADFVLTNVLRVDALVTKAMRAGPVKNVGLSWWGVCHKPT